MNKMSEYNKMPENAIIIENYEEIIEFFTYCMDEETRQPSYTDKTANGYFNLKIWWVKKELGLGFGIANHWKQKKIVWYRFGKEEAWNKFINGFGALFSGDNS